ncbi:MAG: hypothetical protein KGL53_00320 [Elusimicrobia bacterium]|nr:hypothetical protein [Elusimicrobiota bacterium]
MRRKEPDDVPLRDLAPELRGDALDLALALPAHPLQEGRGVSRLQTRRDLGETAEVGFPPFQHVEDLRIGLREARRLDAQIGLVLRQPELARAVAEEGWIPLGSVPETTVEFLQMPEERDENLLLAPGQSFETPREAIVAQYGQVRPHALDTSGARIRSLGCGAGL